MKLIDILNKISKGEIKSGSKYSGNGYELIVQGNRFDWKYDNGKVHSLPINCLNTNFKKAGKSTTKSATPEQEYYRIISQYLFSNVFKDCDIPNEAWLDKDNDILNTTGLGGAFRIMLNAKLYHTITDMSSDITAKTKIIVPVSFIKQCIEDSKDNPVSWEEYHDE